MSDAHWDTTVFLLMVDCYSNGNNAFFISDMFECNYINYITTCLNNSHT